jgi:hypothetical protein
MTHASPLHHRDLLELVVVVALAAGWWLDWREIREQRGKLEADRRLVSEQLQELRFQRQQVSEYLLDLKRPKPGTVPNVRQPLRSE